MEDQYVKVVFPTRRKVWVDDRLTGFTNKPFQLETGHHVFHLGEPVDYRPERREVLVTGTLPDEPMIIEFESATPDSAED